MTLSAFATIIIANLIGASSPGPDVILIIRTATKSRRHALAAVAGIITGATFWVTLTVAGAATLIAAFPSIMWVVQIAGGSWLVYTGFSLVRAGWAARGAVPQNLGQAEASLGSLSKAYYTGMATNLSNPKIVLFLSALIAPLLPPHPSVGLAIALIAAMMSSCAVIFVIYSFILSTARVRRKVLAAGPFIDMAAGAFFAVTGVWLVFSGVREALGL